MYVALPFALTNLLVFHHGEYSYEIILGLLFLTWANDVGAYFTGIYQAAQGFYRFAAMDAVGPGQNFICVHVQNPPDQQLPTRHANASMRQSDNSRRIVDE